MLRILQRLDTVLNGFTLTALSGVENPAIDYLDTFMSDYKRCLETYASTRAELKRRIVTGNIDEVKGCAHSLVLGYGALYVQDLYLKTFDKILSSEYDRIRVSEELAGRLHSLIASACDTRNVVSVDQLEEDVGINAFEKSDHYKIHRNWLLEAQTEIESTVRLYILDLDATNVVQQSHVTLMDRYIHEQIKFVPYFQECIIVNLIRSETPP